MIFKLALKGKCTAAEPGGYFKKAKRRDINITHTQWEINIIHTWQRLSIGLKVLLVGILFYVIIAWIGYPVWP